LTVLRRRLPSGWTGLNALGLVLAASGMLLQIVAGSDLYPSLTGPAVLLVTALLVVLVAGRWTRWIGLAVPLVLGIGAVVAAVMTGEFVDQLTSWSNPAILVGSVMHVTGLAAAVMGGVGAVIDPRPAVSVGR
jgi:hypothetical protein